MKIRIKGNSIRYRLTKSEVVSFCKEGYFVEKTAFPSNTFTYELKAKKGISKLEADFKEAIISLHIPFEEIKGWANSSQIGFQDVQLLSNGEELKLLVEKDFVCLDERDEDESDNYPNPKQL